MARGGITSSGGVCVFQSFLFYFISSGLVLSLRCRLLLNSVHEDDSGAYTCKLSTAKGEPHTLLLKRSKKVIVVFPCCDAL